jgi:Archaeal putative transposase ISC1217.
MGKVKLLVSFNKHGNFNFYVTNRLDWNEVEISKMYSRRWDIEAWHREGKGDYGIEECQLRSG